MIVDTESEPGSWERELRRMPWGYGQSQNTQVKDALAEIRRAGLWGHADVLEREIVALRRELEYAGANADAKSTPR